MKLIYRKTHSLISNNNLKNTFGSSYIYKPRIISFKSSSVLNGYC